MNNLIQYIMVTTPLNRSPQNGEVNFIVEVEPNDVFDSEQPHVTLRTPTSSPRKGAGRSAVVLQGEIFAYLTGKL